jgi:hypothetical protein
LTRAFGVDILPQCLQITVRGVKRCEPWVTHPRAEILLRPAGSNDGVVRVRHGAAAEQRRGVSTFSLVNFAGDHRR